MDTPEWLSENLLLFITLSLMSLVSLGNFIIFCYGSYILNLFMPYDSLFAGFAITIQATGLMYLTMGCFNLTFISYLFPETSMARKSPPFVLATVLWLMTIYGLWLGGSMISHLATFSSSGLSYTWHKDNADYVDFREWGEGRKRWSRGWNLWRVRLYPDIARHIERKFVKDYNNTESSSELFDLMQNKLGCCGVNGSRDYAPLNLSVPLSCCEYSYTTRDCTPSQAYRPGCKKVFATWFRHTVDSVAIITIVVLIIALVAALSASTLSYLKYKKSGHEEA